MFNIAFCLLIGWLLSFVGVDTIFDNLLGFDKQQYYLTFLIIGFIAWIRRAFTRNNK